MKAWKVILAALVIFAAGVVTGGLTMHLTSLQDSPPPVTYSNALGPLRPRGDLLDRMQRQLYLTPVQRDRIEVILRDNHDRMKQLWDSIAPQAQEEHRRVHDLIRAQLNPDQQKKYEDMLKSRGANRSSDDRRHRDPKTPRRTDPVPPSAPGPDRPTR